MGVSMNIGGIGKRIMALALTGGLLILAGCGGQNGGGEAALTGTETGSRGGEENVPEDRTGAEYSTETGSQAAAEAGGQAGTAGSEETDNQAGTEGQTAVETESGTGTKKLSILGDSISTFDGWIPEGYACFFPMNGDVAQVEQTWWQIVLQNTGMELCVNGSSSGSTCAGDSTSPDDCGYGCSDYRIGDLIRSDGCLPDVIIVYMGTNDFMKAVPLGDNDGTQVVEEGVIENFSDAYCLILDKLIDSYPDAEIYCCNLPEMGVWGPASGPVFVPFVNGLELTPADYGKRIEIIAAAKGCEVIDLKNCGITMENLQWYVSDGVHLNPEGMELVGSAVTEAVN